MTRRAGTPEGPLTLITGGAGFIGTNLADRLLSQGAPVLVLDDTSRPGVHRNLGWLRTRQRPPPLLFTSTNKV
jgi:CDP-paratose 2-epimerase